MSDTCVLGTGIDIVENSRMRLMLERWGPRFKNRVFLSQERAYCDGKPHPYNHYAGRFAVKEAVSKAMGTGVGEHIGWLDIEVTRNAESGAPSVRLSDRAWNLLRTRGASRVLVSLSHTHQHAVAQALVLAV